MKQAGRGGEPRGGQRQGVPFHAVVVAVRHDGGYLGAHLELDEEPGVARLAKVGHGQATFGFSPLLASLLVALVVSLLVVVVGRPRGFFEGGGGGREGGLVEDLVDEGVAKVGELAEGGQGLVPEGVLEALGTVKIQDRDGRVTLGSLGRAELLVGSFMGSMDASVCAPNIPGTGRAWHRPSSPRRRPSRG